MPRKRERDALDWFRQQLEEEIRKGFIDASKIRAGNISETAAALTGDPETGRIILRQDRATKSPTTTEAATGTPEPASDQAPPKRRHAPRPVPRWRARAAAALRAIADLLTRANGSSGQ